MKYHKTYFLLSLILILFLPGCSVIAGIFKAGFWTAIILVVLVIAIVIYAIKKLGGSK